MSYEQELKEFRDALKRPIVGFPSREQELAELRRLIERYPEDARTILAQLGR